MTLIDDIILELDKKYNNFNKLLPIIDNKVYIKQKMKKRYGDILYLEYENIIELIILKLTHADNKEKVKRDLDILFCECKPKRQRSSSWTN